MKRSYTMLRAWITLTFILALSVGMLIGSVYDDCLWLTVVGFLLNCTAFFIIINGWVHEVKDKDRINKALTKSELENKEMYYYITRIANSRNHRVSANKLLQRLEGR